MTNTMPKMIDMTTTLRFREDVAMLQSLIERQEATQAMIQSRMAEGPISKLTQMRYDENEQYLAANRQKLADMLTEAE
jgi:hypothetical protein